jgi:lipoprotein-anchoring transpeptidase ErfK/SrfK
MRVFKENDKTMLSKFKSNREFLRKLSFLVMMPVIFMSLVQCMPGTEPKQSENTSPSKSQPADNNVPQNSRIDITPPLEPIHRVKKDNMNANPIPSLDEERSDLPVSSNLPVLLDKATIVVDISEQELYLYEGHQATPDNLVESYPVSTSKYGIGSRAGSNKTPLGRHYIKDKIGAGAPEKMIFKARRRTGRLAEINGKDVGDLVTSRIMWLKGLEPGKNSGRGVDSYKRYIYIHGTAEEYKIGEKASHGCVRMYNRDVIDLFDRVKEGTEVYIRR